MRRILLVVGAATAAMTLAFSASASATSIALPPDLQAKVFGFAKPLCDQQGGLFYLGSGGGGTDTYKCSGELRIGDLLKGATVCKLIVGGTFSILPRLHFWELNNGYACTFSVPIVIPPGD